MFYVAKQPLSQRKIEIAVFQRNYLYKIKAVIKLYFIHTFKKHKSRTSNGNSGLCCLFGIVLFVLLYASGVCVFAAYASSESTETLLLLYLPLWK